MGAPFDGNNIALDMIPLDPIFARDAYPAHTGDTSRNVYWGAYQGSRSIRHVF